MLPIAIVKWTPEELTAQATDETWFKLSIMADQRKIPSISTAIRNELNQPNDARGLRRITFWSPESNAVMEMVEQSA
jgi:hypothetical protein